MLGMLKENDQFSLTRVLPTIGYITFVVISLFLAVTGSEWSNYGEFALATGGGVIVQLGNKWVNSKYNTEPGEVGKC